MIKSYILLYSELFGEQQFLTTVLDSCSSVITWRYDLPNAIYFTSEYDARHIALEIEDLVGTSTGRFMVLEYNGNAEGRITSDSWYFLNNKEFKPQQPMPE